MALVALSLPAMLLAGRAFAAPAETAALSERDFFEELPVVLSVSRLAQPLDETPGAVTVIDRDIIRKSGARELTDLLRLVPGFIIGQWSGANPVAAYHGAFNNFGSHLQVFVDGRSVYSTFFLGNTQLGMMGVVLDDIERIEVLRGSNSAAYGANAFLGVVNIVTRHAADTRGAQVSLSSGERGIDDNTVRAGFGNDRASFRVTLARRADSGLDNLYDDKRVEQLHLRGDLRTSPRDEVTLLAGAVGNSFGDGFSNRPENPQRTSKFDSAYGHAKWRRELADGGELRAAASLDVESTSNAVRYRDSLPPVVETVLDFGGKARRANVEMQHVFRWGSSARFVWGGEYRHEQVESGPLYYRTDPLSSHQWRWFGNAEWRPHARLVVNAGALWEKHSIVGARFSPRVFGNLHLTDRHTLRAGVSRAHRAPTLYELRGDTRYFDTAGNLPPFLAHPVFGPMLRANTYPFGGGNYSGGILLANTVRATGRAQPETLLAHEIGYIGEFPGLRLNVDVRAFHEAIDSLVRNFGYANYGFLYQLATLPPIHPALVKLQTSDFTNRPGVKIYGWEYQAQWRPLAGSRILLSQSFVRIDSPELTEQHNAPTDTTSLAWFQDLPGNWTTSIMFATTGAMSWGAYPRDLLKSEHQLDLRLAKSFRIGPTRGEIAWTVQQANGPRQEYLPTYTLDRRAFMTLRLEY